MGDPLPFPSFSSGLFQLSSFSLAYLRQSSFLFLFILRPLLLFLPSFRQSRIFTRSWPVRTAGSSRESAERFAFFWTRAAVPPFHRLSHHHPRPVVLFLAISFTGVFPLSSRKKFFYNFRIVLFRPSRFFQPRAGRSPQVGFTPPSSAAFSTATHVRLCFLLSRFHLVQPFLCYRAFPHGLSLVLVVPTASLFFLLTNCTRSRNWRSFN